MLLSLAVARRMLQMLLLALHDRCCVHATSQPIRVRMLLSRSQTLQLLLLLLALRDRCCVRAFS